MIRESEERLTFQEVVRLLNKTRITKISSASHEKEGKWILCNGEHRFRTDSYTFRFLYIYANATQQDIEEFSRDFPQQNLHVVCPPSVAQRKYIHSILHKVKGIWNTKEYITSLISNEIDLYREKLKELSPQFYVKAQLDGPENFLIKPSTDPLLRLLLDQHPPSEKGVLAVVLAEAGQGKTYLCKHLVARMANSSLDFVPILVDSSQWGNLSIEDQRSLWKTIVHSFRHFDSFITWLDGCELDFLKATLKADVFRLIFDGFDEYIMRNRSAIQPIEVLTALNDLARETGAKLLLTSRTTFWNTSFQAQEVQDFIKQSDILVFRILPFDYNHAKTYFTGRLREDEASIERALNIFNRFRQSSEILIGRGFVLPLIADLSEDSAYLDEAHGLLWLLDALCRREIIRHELPYYPSEQLSIYDLQRQKKPLEKS